MTYFPDLTPYRYSVSMGAVESLNVGWLSIEHPYTQGDVPPEFVEKLGAYCRAAPMSLRTMGLHLCEFCAANQIDCSAYEGALGNGEIRVAGANGRRYAAPVMILHYVVKHYYRPPDEFIQAVLEAPLPGSPEYEALLDTYAEKVNTAPLLTNGGLDSTQFLRPLGYLFITILIAIACVVWPKLTVLATGITSGVLITAGIRDEKRHVYSPAILPLGIIFALATAVLAWMLF